MPDQTNTDAQQAEQQPDPRDLRIKELEAQVKDLTGEINEMNEDRDQVEAGYDAEIKDLKKALVAAQKAKPAPVLPDSDCVILDGVRHDIISTVRANTTFDEVKKGFVDEGATLVVIDRKH